MKYILPGFGLICFICIIGFGIYALSYLKPDFSKEGQRVLIDNRDTAIIIQQERIPEWAGRKPRFTVSYKDSSGKYAETEVSENRITFIEE